MKYERKTNLFALFKTRRAENQIPWLLRREIQLHKGKTSDMWSLQMGLF